MTEVTTAPPERDVQTVLEPPRTVIGTLRRIGPGLILAGAIVGSGELIATPMVGASAGFWLLWLVLLGCTLKVFTQIEFGRHTITWGETALEALDHLPGPRWRVNWLLWFWFAVVLLIISQNGGIVGGVGQSLAMSFPLTEEGRTYNTLNDELVLSKVDLALQATRGLPAAEVAARQAQIDGTAARVAALPVPQDEAYWAILVALATAVVMYYGRYKFIEVVTTILVVGFTLVTILAVVMLQSTEWAVHGSDIAQGLSFRLPPVEEGSTVRPLAIALAAFGMIGLSAGELIMYPYWCLEKGYAAYAGPRDATEGWTHRARGWMRVLHLDVWVSMVLYTFATVAFYLLGAAVLAPSGLNPGGEAMVRTLTQMYVPVFGPRAEDIFLFGAFAVLYSTYFVFAAGFARMIADALVLLRVIDGEAETRRRWTRWLSAALPLLALVVYLFVRAPVAMVLAAGLGQAAILPFLGAAALFFRYRRLDPRLRPTLVRDVLLWLSFLGLAVAGTWSVYSNLF